MPIYLGLDIGSNSVGSAWVNTDTGEIVTGISIFPAGVDESDEKRGDPKNAKRRMARRTRITLARRSERKRALRLKLIAAGLLPRTQQEFALLLETTDPWDLRRRGLDEPLHPYEFGRVLLHLAQRRGALGLKPIADDIATDESAVEDGKVKAAIQDVRQKMLDRKARSFGEFIAMLRAERVNPITTKDARAPHRRKGPREFRTAVRNRGGNYEHCSDRAMIQSEFAQLWDAQERFGGETAKLLLPDLRAQLDSPSTDSTWRHRGLLFGQRRQSWDLGTLGRCVLEPTERCAPHADMYASKYLVVETVNNLKIIERGKEARPLTPEERNKIKNYLCGPLGMEKGRKRKGDTKHAAERPKTKVSVADLRELMGWPRASKSSPYSFNIEADEDRLINTDWFSREIIHGAITPAIWESLTQDQREGLNRALLKFDPSEPKDEAKLLQGVTTWGGLSADAAAKLVAAWRLRPNPETKRLSLSRRAVRNLLALMDRDEPWPDPEQPGKTRWLSQVAARRMIAADGDFEDVTTGKKLDDHTRRRYATGTKGATARDRRYLRKHILRENGEPIFDDQGHPISEPPPAPLVSNPVVRKAIHEVRRHVVEYLVRFGRRPDYVCVELAREARMGKRDADRLLFKNRLRNRIRNDILTTFHLDSVSATQQRAAVDRVVLGAQQGWVCPLCGQRDGLTPMNAAHGRGCELAHILPRGSGGDNGLGNLVLAHTKCNRDMDRRTPRQFWEASLPGGFDAGVIWIEKIYSNVERIKPAELKSTTGDALWACYFDTRDDRRKLEQFKKNISDIKTMTERQDAATKYASRQVMSYLADALFGGEGLPERGGQRRIFTTDGIWTSRLRREWGLFFDPHQKRAKGLSNTQVQERKEKDRGDHRHHAIDAIVIALCDSSLKARWDERERQADRERINTADEAQMDSFRKSHPLLPPSAFSSVGGLRAAVQEAVFGHEKQERPICHRPVKRKLIGALHEETLFGPILDRAGQLTSYFTARKSVLSLTPKHLRLPRPESTDQAIARLAARRQQAKGVDSKTARNWAKEVVASSSFIPRLVEPLPEKSGIVRDIALRKRIRQCLSEAGVNPDSFSTNELKKVVEQGALRQASGVPIRSVVLLRAMSDPVIVPRKRPDYETGKLLPDDNPASMRAYLSGNNHHLEIRVSKDKHGKDIVRGQIVSAFEAAQRKLARLRAIRMAGVPKPSKLRRLPKKERLQWRTVLKSIDAANPIVDRRYDDAKGGQFLMSLCEGETLWLRQKPRKKGDPCGDASYFVVAKLEKGDNAVLVPHWDARAAGEQKDSSGNKVPNSKREQFSITPSDLKTLAPPGHPFAVKVRVSALGKVTVLKND
jgi:CRISPR-associated endonuclease Csn1